MIDQLGILYECRSGAIPRPPQPRQRAGLVQHARGAAEELVAMIYGLWSNLANRAIADPDKARSILFRYLRVRIPEFAELRLSKA